MPYTLLLADDSVTIQRVIELTFADEDVTVVAVSDGDQAIERLEASPPDIVLADIGMPGKNGYEVAQYIRQSPRLAHIPVVLLTGAFEPVDQARADAAGCDGVLAKPFEPQMVIGRVKELLARSRRDPEIPVSDARTAGRGEDDVPTSPVARNALNDYFDRLDAAFSALPSNVPGQAPPPGEPVASPAPVATDASIDWFAIKTTDGADAEPWDLPMPPADAEPVDLPLSYASPQPEASGAPAREVAAPDPETAIVPPESAEPPAPVVPPEPLEPAATVVRVSPVAPLEPSEPLAPFAPVEPVAPVSPVAPLATVVPAIELPLPNPPPLPALADAFAALLAAEQGEPQSSIAVIWPASPPSAAAASEALIEDVTRRVIARLSDTVVREAVADIASKVAERLVREEIERIKASIK